MLELPDEGDLHSGNNPQIALREQTVQIRADTPFPDTARPRANFTHQRPIDPPIRQYSAHRSYRPEVVFFGGHPEATLERIAHDTGGGSASGRGEIGRASCRERV